MAEPSNESRGQIKHERIIVLDGIRGWAALSVLLFHVIYESFGVLVPWFRNDIFYVLLNGTLAVSVFFILSGEALSYGYLKSCQTGLSDTKIITKGILKRYVRLTIPILVSCLIVYVLMRYELNFNDKAAKILHREDWLGSFLQFAPKFDRMIHYSMFGVYIGQHHRVSYNPFLWTMAYELSGSFLVFLFLYIYDKIKYPLVTILGMIGLLLFSHSYYLCFFIGILFSYLRVKNYFAFLQQTIPGYVSFCALLLLLFLFIAMREHPFPKIIITLSTAAILLFLIYINDNVSSLFTNRISQFLGHISYPLYLIHFSIIVSFMSFMIMLLQDADNLGAYSISLIIVSSISLSIFAACLFQYVETYNFMVCKILEKKLLL